MFALGAATRVYVATGITDMRMGFDGLYGKIRDVLESDPTSGHIFLFSNARRNRLKLVFLMVPGYGYVPSAWRADVFTGRRLLGARGGYS
jgi:transposase